MDRAQYQSQADEWITTICKFTLWGTNHWLDIPIAQIPEDLHIMQEIIFKTKPRIIVETGTAAGGSALFYASMLNLIGGGRVVSIDHHNDLPIVRQNLDKQAFEHDIVLIHGDSIAPETVQFVRNIVGDEERALVCLDSDHTTKHVLAELHAYRNLVPIGGYLVVFDTVVRMLSAKGLSQYTRFGATSPKHAVDIFLQENSDFVADVSWERLMITFCPGGFLRRIK